MVSLLVLWPPSTSLICRGCQPVRRMVARWRAEEFEPETACRVLPAPLWRLSLSAYVRTFFKSADGVWLNRQAPIYSVPVEVKDAVSETRVLKCRDDDPDAFARTICKCSSKHPALDVLQVIIFLVRASNYLSGAACSMLQANSPKDWLKIVTSNYTSCLLIWWRGCKKVDGPTPLKQFKCGIGFGVWLSSVLQYCGFRPAENVAVQLAYMHRKGQDGPFWV